jgi:hypothetical protein
MPNLVSARQLETFMNDIKSLFPTYVAGVICDRHGFPIASRIDHPQIDEETLALSAISDRKLLDMDMNEYHKVVRPLSMDTKLMVLLKKSGDNLHRFKQFKNMVESKNPM